MKLLVIDIKDGEAKSREETVGDLLPEGPAFEQFADDILNGMDYTWKDIGDDAWEDI